MNLLIDNLLIGFEFEGCVNCDNGNSNTDNDNDNDNDNDTFKQFTRGLRKLGVTSIGDDCSVDIPIGRWNDCWDSIEFRTPPKPFNEGIEMLDNILSYLHIMSTENIFRTNHSCGFHINISYPKFKGAQRSYFFCKFAQLLDERKISKTFKRGNNEYCRPFIPSNQKRDFKNSIRRFYALGGTNRYTPDKYRAVTFRSYSNGRIEIRAPGNKDYQLRINDIYDVLRMIKQSANKALKYVYLNKIKSTSPLYEPLLTSKFTNTMKRLDLNVSDSGIAGYIRRQSRCTYW